MAAIDRQFPLQPKIPFVAIVRVVRDDWYEQRTRLDLLADRGIPRVPAPQLAAVEPHLYARFAQRLAQLLRRRRILRRVAQEHRFT